MAYTDDAVKAKLSSLNETQDSIVTVAQWLLFHRRYAQRTAEMWMSRLEQSPAKRLTFLYLANEVVQQSKARKKEDFVKAFSPLIAEAIATAYQSSNLDIQKKISRVVEIWRQRSIFDTQTQEEIEARLNEINKTRSNRKPALGGSLFSDASSSAPSEFQPILTAHSNLTKFQVRSTPAVRDIKTRWDKMADDIAAEPSPHVNAARLGSLLRALSDVEGTVSECIKARTELIQGLEKLLTDNKKALSEDQRHISLFHTYKQTLDSEKAKAERDILHGSLEVSYSGEGAASAGDGFELERPDAEPLTPPPVESLTPVGSPKRELDFGIPATQPPAAVAAAAPQNSEATAGLNGSNQLTLDEQKEESNLGADGVNGEPALKRRKLETGPQDEFAAFAVGGPLDMIDDDVAEMLAKE